VNRTGERWAPTCRARSRLVRPNLAALRDLRQPMLPAPHADASPTLTEHARQSEEDVRGAVLISSVAPDFSPARAALKGGSTSDWEGTTCRPRLTCGRLGALGDDLDNGNPCCSQRPSRICHRSRWKVIMEIPDRRSRPS
jgi:hypothetical protein